MRLGRAQAASIRRWLAGAAARSRLPNKCRIIICEARAALSLEDRETLVVGDMLATISMVPAESRPHLPPRFTNDDHERALASLQKIELVKARRLAVRVLVHGPVHGDPALVLADSLASSAPMNAAYRSPPRP